MNSLNERCALLLLLRSRCHRGRIRRRYHADHTPGDGNDCEVGEVNRRLVERIQTDLIEAGAIPLFFFLKAAVKMLAS